MIKIKNKNKIYLFWLCILSVISIALYLSISVNFTYIQYALSIRIPKAFNMIIAAFSIGFASVVFQSIINNKIVTPCLLGVNSLYLLINTSIVFFLGTKNILVTSKPLSFLFNLVIMCILSVLIYGFLFKKTKNNILYILLTGTVISTFFTSITSTLQRVMDPNDFTVLQNSIIPGFHKASIEMVIFSIVFIFICMFIFKNNLKILDVITLGRDQSISLGVDYNKSTLNLMILVTMLISIATALVGPISFLGLISANLSRQIFKTYKHKYLILGASFSGFIMLIWGQTLIEHIFNFSTNITVFINIGGGIYFLYLILKNRS
ncbi:MAG: iron chelate uptake ABC transporter family permease subunit [Oscillospiraceae bacterium]